MIVKKVDVVFVIIIAILTLISIDFLINESHREIIENISKYEPFQNLSSALLITFIVCLVGNLLPFPTPYTFVVCFSTIPFLNQNPFIPLLVGLIASLGCLVGEMAGYVVGRGVSEILSEERMKNLKNWQKYIIEHPKLAPFLVYLVALTPISDDMIIIPLGLLKYSPKKTIFWCWSGKLGLMLVFAYNLINICSYLGGGSWILSIITLFIIIISVYLLIRINIFEFFEMIFSKRNTSTK